MDENVSRFLVEKILSPVFGQIFLLAEGLNITLKFLTPKGASLRETATFEPSRVKTHQAVWPVGEFLKNKSIS